MWAAVKMHQSLSQANWSVLVCMVPYSPHIQNILETGCANVNIINACMNAGACLTHTRMLC